ncbi:MAG: PfkB family carbohydrate kinase [Gaiellales bacterium]
MRVVSLGDLVLDVVVKLAQPLAIGADAASVISISPGGQGANVAAWVAFLGGEAAWLGKRADDDGGRLAAAGLEGHGVELLGPVAPSGGGVIVSLVAPDGERSMCPDRGAATSLRPDEIAPAMVACDHLHVSGYSLATEPVRAATIHAVGLAREQGARISVDLSSWSVIRDVGTAEFGELLLQLEPNVVFANELELEAIGGQIGSASWIVKRGADGCGFDGVLRPAVAVPETVDTTGAGDALAAGWILGGPELALEAAARCVQRMGAMP